MWSRAVELCKVFKYSSGFITGILILPLAIIPLIVQVKVNPLGAEALGYWSGNLNADLFSYYKSNAICIIALVVGVMILIRRERIQWPARTLLVATMAACIIVSALLSPYPHTSLYGFPDRYEGMFVLLAYLVLFLGASMLIEGNKQISILMASFYCSAALIGSIGMLQFIGLDIFDTGIGSHLTDIGRKMESMHLTRMIHDGATLFSPVYGTLYNPNTFGMYMAVLFPASFFMSLFIKDKKIRLLLFFLSCLAFGNLIASCSRGAMIAAFVSLLATSCILGQKLGVHRKSLISRLFLLLLIGATLNVYSSGVLGTRVASLFVDSGIHQEDEKIDKIKDFEINHDTLTLRCTDAELNVKIEDMKLAFYDDAGLKLRAEAVGGKGEYWISNDRYRHLRIFAAENFIKFQKGKSFLYFAIAQEQFLFLNPRGEAETLDTVKHTGFKGFERIGSGRGYIWSRSMPLLLENVFFGKGPDTFAYVFPQKDYRGKLNYMYDAYLIIDKPHNWYLQTALNTGLVSLSALLGLVLSYIFVAIIEIRSTQGEGELLPYCVSIFSAIIAFAIAGLFTDSTVSVTPIFWMLLGMGYWSNNKLSVTAD